LESLALDLLFWLPLRLLLDHDCWNAYFMGLFLYSDCVSIFLVVVICWFIFLETLENIHKMIRLFNNFSFRPFSFTSLYSSRIRLNQLCLLYIWSCRNNILMEYYSLFSKYWWLYYFYLSDTSWSWNYDCRLRSLSLLLLWGLLP